MNDIQNVIVSPRPSVNAASLGPIRREVCAVLAMARDICEDFGEHHASRHAHIALRAIHSANYPNARDLLEAAESFDPWVSHEDIHPWLQNASKFCADVLRWTHEEERRREVHVLGSLFWSVVDVDPQTRAPTSKGWTSIAQDLEALLGYSVRVDDGIRLRHGVLTHDPDHGFLFTRFRKIII
jgi:hypothetical protein